MIEQMLDQLAEFQAQATLLEMDKRRLLDEVRIPAEVLKAQEDANMARQAIEAEFWKQSKLTRDYAQHLIGELVKPELPPEYLAAMEKYRLDCETINRQCEKDIEIAQENVINAKAKIDNDLTAKVQDVYTQVETRKREIAAEFGEKEDAVKDNIDKLTADIKEAVIEEGRTIKGKFYQAVYMKGRVTWNTDMLDGLAVVIPEVAKARKEGQPSVTLRKL
jgi:hypothetical protein